MEWPQFEIFMKVVDEDFKGFAVIFHEDEEKRMKQTLKSLKSEGLIEDVRKEALRNTSL